ncbi:MAG: DUF455 family protein, partial [Opitutae bacterium]|nr:DUF455 family protein [Opitutae bacterium]
RRVQDLRIRGRELGVSFQEMHFSAGVAGRELLDSLCSARQPADLLAAGVGLVNRTLIAAIDDYLKRNDSVYDLPSVPLLEADREELREQAAWAEAAVAELAAAAGQHPDGAFVRRIAAQCTELPAALRDHAARNPAPVRAGRRIGSLPLAGSRLPLGFRDLEHGPERPPAESAYRDRELYHAINFLQEVQATDSCATMLFEAPDMPWDFYFDLSRHMWDESRHSMFGERKLDALGSSAATAGLSSKAFELRQTLAPPDRYAALTTQEADAFPGKHAGLKDAIAHGDTLSAMAWSYDIADETQHVRFGARWLPVLIEKTQDPRSLDQVQADARTWRSSVLAKVYQPAGRPVH